MRTEREDGLELDDDPARIDIDAVHAFISGESYWGKGRARETVEKAIKGSTRVVGLYDAGRQVGFARAVTDGAIHAYMADVYVLAPYRGRGLGLAMVGEMVDHGPFRELRWMLHTADAQGLYEKIGFVVASLAYPVMERPRRYDSRP
jgi:ribosomal protein S18 acetylase RimI-like enzyme